MNRKIEAIKCLAVLPLLFALLVGCTTGEPSPDPAADRAEPLATSALQTIATLPPVNAEGWSTVMVEALCLAIDKSFVDEVDESQIDLPIRDSAALLLNDLGMEIVEERQGCDATLTVSFTFDARMAEYSLAAKDCYAGAFTSAEGTLAAPGQPSVSVSAEYYLPPPEVISGCLETPADAPYDETWAKVLLPIVYEFWGSPHFLMTALTTRVAAEQPFFMASADLLKAEYGSEAYPYLLEVLHDEDPQNHLPATEMIVTLYKDTPGAMTIVPGLISLLMQEDYPSAPFLEWPLEEITGEDFGLDGEAWSAWWENQP